MAGCQDNKVHLCPVRAETCVGAPQISKTCPSVTSLLLSRGATRGLRNCHTLAHRGKKEEDAGA